MATSLAANKEMLGRKSWLVRKIRQMWQLDNICTNEQEVKEITKIFLLPGAVPRFVTASELYGLPIKGCRQGAEVIAKKLVD